MLSTLYGALLAHLLCHPLAGAIERRGLARERKRKGLGPELPFELIGRADGRLTLADPGTGRRVDLDSFGPDNSAVFASLMLAR